MARLIKILFLLIFVISCSKYYSVYSECDNTQQAIEGWMDIEDFDYYFSKREHSANIIIRKWNNTMILGAYYGHGVIDSIDDFAVIAHELGHFLGYDHSTNPNSIMYRVRLSTATNFVDLVKE